MKIRQFILSFLLCFIVLIGTQLINVNATSYTPNQSELSSSLNEEELQAQITSDDSTVEESSEIIEEESDLSGETDLSDNENYPGEVKEELIEIDKNIVTDREEETPEGVEDDLRSQENEENQTLEDEVSDVYEYQYSVENIELLAVDSNQLPFPVVIRDFKADGFIFEGEIDGGTKNMVNKVLTSSKKPEFTDDGIHAIVKLNYETYYNKLSSTQRTQLLADAKQFYETNKNKAYSEVKSKFDKSKRPYEYLVYHLNKLFLNVDGLNTSIEQTLQLTKNASGIYQYIDPSFFPIDNKLYGNEKRNHNYHFTLESHTQFYFDGKTPLTFDFTGDDDVWVYVNGQQVIDLGGVHSQQSQSFTISASGEVVGGNGSKFTLNQAGWYDFDFFFMERHTTQSNLKISTNMVFAPKIEIEKIPYMINAQGEEVTVTSKDVVYPGETVYYKFIVKNAGNVDLTNVVIEDPLLKVRISKDGVTKDGNNVAAYQIINNGEEGKIEHLNDLKAPNLDTLGTTLEIKSNSFYYIVTDSDAQKQEIVNEATVTAKHKNDEVFENASATVNVGVKDVDSTIIKLGATIKKSIKTVNGQNYTTQTLLNPGDNVVFEIKITNKSMSENKLTGTVPIAIDKLKLDDVLKLGDYTKNDFILKLNGQDFNHSDFSLGPNESITLTVEWTVVEPSGTTYTGDNTVSLSRKKTSLGGSQVSFKLAKPNLQIKKEVIGTADENQTFEIKVTGSDNSSVTISLQNGETKVVENLHYGVTYTITEVNMPSHYELHSISHETLTLTKDSANTLVTVKNIERPSLSITKKIEGQAPSEDSFVIKVKGSDGSLYNVRLKANETAVLKHLSYGVTYTVSEVVPMNYELVGIDKSEVVFNENNRSNTVTVTNKLVNDTWFFDRTWVENLFKISK